MLINEQCKIHNTLLQRLNIHQHIQLRGRGERDQDQTTNYSVGTWVFFIIIVVVVVVIRLLFRTHCGLKMGFCVLLFKYEIVELHV